jgi:hypothetical protein
MCAAVFITQKRRKSAFLQIFSLVLFTLAYGMLTAKYPPLI